MAKETLQLVPSRALNQATRSYVVNFSGDQRQQAGVRYRLGYNDSSGPVAYKVALTKEAEERLRRELEVSRYLENRGGELLSKCLGYNFREQPASAVVTFRGRPLAEIVQDTQRWPLEHVYRMKVITDLLQGLELLRVSRIVHGAISLATLRWDGNTLQLTDFGQAALFGEYPDGRPAHHGDDVGAACRVIYHVYTGQEPPGDPVALRHQLEHVQDAELRELLLHRDLVAGKDVNYAFAELSERRPTSRMLLDRLDRRPRGVQWAHLVAKDRSVRNEFRRLRERQQAFSLTYHHWAARRPRRVLRPPREAKVGINVVTLGEHAFRIVFWSVIASVVMFIIAVLIGLAS